MRFNSEHYAVARSSATLSADEELQRAIVQFHFLCVTLNICKSAASAGMTLLFN